mgnify:CR=1 FL=1
MGFTFLKKLPTPAEIRNQYPIDAAIQELKAKRDQEIRDVFTGKSDKFLAIIGPCSADNEDAVCDYLLRLRKVQDKIADKVLIIPRVYTNKPRTTGEGYKGMVHQPDPEKAPDMLAGLIAIRKMHIHAIQESGFTSADEMLYPENWRYLSDILSYVAVGARSVEDQQHRLTVSGMDVPAGMKNPTSGDYIRPILEVQDRVQLDTADKRILILFQFELDLLLGLAIEGFEARRTIFLVAVHHT